MLKILRVSSAIKGISSILGWMGGKQQSNVSQSEMHIVWMVGMEYIKAVSC